MHIYIVHPWNLFNSHRGWEMVNANDLLVLQQIIRYIGQVGYKRRWSPSKAAPFRLPSLGTADFEDVDIGVKDLSMDWLEEPGTPRLLLPIWAGFPVDFPTTPVIVWINFDDRTTWWEVRVRVSGRKTFSILRILLGKTIQTSSLEVYATIDSFPLHISKHRADELETHSPFWKVYCVAMTVPQWHRRLGTPIEKSVLAAQPKSIL